MSLAELLGLCPKVCCWEGCAAAVTVSTKFVGCSVTLTFKSSTGHAYTWHSSSQHANENSSIFSNNLSLASVIVYSGNLFAKIKRLFDIVQLECLSQSMFYRYELFIIKCNTNTWRFSCQCRYQNLYLINQILAGTSTGTFELSI